jgi:hypothetical protein
MGGSAFDHDETFVLHKVASVPVMSICSTRRKPAT